MMACDVLPVAMFFSVCTIEWDLDGFVTQLFCAGSQGMECCQHLSCSTFLEVIRGQACIAKCYISLLSGM